MNFTTNILCTLGLLTVISCSSIHSNPSATQQPVATDEQAITPTPKEVNPGGCLCNKIFMPVCADGRTFSNSCEAECNGLKSWTEGSCFSKK